jgi:putative SOS response-associated peptidase YedK
MCGRFVLDASSDELIRKFMVEKNAFPDWVPRWNIAPTSTIPIIIKDAESARVLTPARWSLVPPSAPELTTPYSTFNARTESAAAKRTFAGPLRHSRCLIPARGYYEWSLLEGVKKPFFLHRQDRGMFSMAGLMSWWQAPGSHTAQATATILTRASAGPLTAVHDRMPVIVSRDNENAWLDTSDTDGATLLKEISQHTQNGSDQWDFYSVDPLTGEGAHLTHPESANPLL